MELPRSEFDKDRDHHRKFHLSDFKETISLVLKTSELRSLAFGCFAFVGLQTTFVAYFVLYLTVAGYSLSEAGKIFSIATAVAIIGRILWGWISSHFIKPRTMLGLLAMGMFISAWFTGSIKTDWYSWQILFVAIGVSASVFSWHGVVLAEAARLAPPSMRGAITGGILSFGQFGGLLLPLVYSFLLSLTGGYHIGFKICAIPALIVGLQLLYSAFQKNK